MEPQNADMLALLSTVLCSERAGRRDFPEKYQIFRCQNSRKQLATVLLPTAKPHAGAGGADGDSANGRGTQELWEALLGPVGRGVEAGVSHGTRLDRIVSSCVATETWGC